MCRLEQTDSFRCTSGVEAYMQTTEYLQSDTLRGVCKPWCSCRTRAVRRVSPKSVLIPLPPISLSRQGIKKKKNQRARSVFLFPSFVSVVCAAPIFPFPSRASPLCFQERLCLLDIPSSASPVRLCTPSPESHVEKTLVLAKPQRAHIGGRNGCRNARYPSSD